MARCRAEFDGFPAVATGLGLIAGLGALVARFEDVAGYRIVVFPPFRARHQRDVLGPDREVGDVTVLRSGMYLCHHLGAAREPDTCLVPGTGQAAAGKDRQSVAEGKRVSVRFDLGGRRVFTNKTPT